VYDVRYDRTDGNEHPEERSAEHHHRALKKLDQHPYNFKIRRRKEGRPGNS